MTKKILVVDDEPNILTLLKMNLEMNRYEVVTAETGQAAIDMAVREKPDLILLDLMLPDIDGTSVCQRIRTAPDTRVIPIIMLTAKTDEMDMIVGLEVGADDYITKPFSIREVVTRIKVLFRRIDELTAHENKVVEREHSEVKVHDMFIDKERLEITIHGELVDLTRMEFKILLYLAENRARVVSRHELVEALIEKDKKPDEKSLNVHIWNIRKNLKSTVVKLNISRQYVEPDIGCLNYEKSCYD